jgi:hypothetical protein
MLLFSSFFVLTALIVIPVSPFAAGILGAFAPCAPEVSIAFTGRPGSIVVVPSSLLDNFHDDGAESRVSRFRGRQPTFTTRVRAAMEGRWELGDHFGAGALRGNGAFAMATFRR